MGYVSSECPSAIGPVTPGWASATDTAGNAVELYYSYEACGTLNCYNKTGGGCPYDPEGHCTERHACDCKYRDGHIPELWYNNSIHKDSDYIPIYGTTCAKWDSMKDSPYWNSSCKLPENDLCTNSWCLEAWCYVDSDCPHANTGSPAWMNRSDIEVFYSYAVCGFPDCFKDENQTGCPYDDPRDNITCGSTCGDIKTYYKEQECCGMPGKMVERMKR